MTALLTEPQAPKALSKAQRTRARVIGIVLLLLAGFVAIVFAAGTEGDASFGLSRAQDAIQLGPLVLPAAGTAWAVAVLLAFAGAVQLTRGFGDKASLVLGIGLLLFVFAFLAWAAADRSFSLVGMLDSTLVKATPIALAALAGIISERSSIINIGIEGMLLSGAFAGVLVASVTGSGLVGLAASVAIGGVLAAFLAVMSIKYRVDQIITGVVINLFALGLTSFLTSQVLVARPELNNAPIFRAIKIPILGDIPVIGPVLFNQTILVYGMYALVAAFTIGFFHTRWGLRTRAVSEHPGAADTLGVNVYFHQYLGTIIGGMVAGFGGAYFTLGTVGRFDENITAGRGFIGLAAMIFGRWHPIGGLAAALVFGFSDSLSQKLAILQTPIPSEFLLMAPYIVTIIVVAGVVGRSRPPAAEGKPYVKE
ncbi:MAG: ABC transporter permease [Acidimicrobiia bacterium]